MKLYTLDFTQCLPISLEEAWTFFSDPRNLARITPDSLSFNVTSEIPDGIYLGLIITYIIRPILGIPVRWVTEITQVEEHCRFVDEQRFGPYRFWHHTHLFSEMNGGVKLRDLVHYSPKPALLGGLVNTLWVSKQLQNIFEYRRKILQSIFGEVAKMD